MQPLIWDHRPTGLRDPAMVCAFEGWNDAGDAASTAVRFLATALGAERFAHVDTEEFYDFQANRPRIRFAAEGTDSAPARREIEWPSVEVYEVIVPDAPRDLVLVQGVEPSLRWRSFSALIVELAEALGVRLVITVGALLADVPHTLPVAMTGFASDPTLTKRLGAAGSPPSRYEGPTGIVGVLHSAASEAGLPAMSLWASVPHYVAAAPSPKAALALVRRLEDLVGVSVDAEELEEAASNYERQVGLAVSSNPEVQAFVERLEQDAEGENVDDEDEERQDGGWDPLSLEDLPSGELLAREFQRFLRQRGGEGKPGA
ncbi:MAG TPA: PAC2 family protein [Solirubrobacteraceae bacterium]|jgi:predicted ATP-grasp superfamily ATP-dependent carboligase|nr:PAC2 family protein [Solirubrobacteraceae bacterium]